MLGGWIGGMLGGWIGGITGCAWIAVNPPANTSGNSALARQRTEGSFMAWRPQYFEATTKLPNFTRRVKLGKCRLQRASVRRQGNTFQQSKMQR